MTYLAKTGPTTGDRKQTYLLFQQVSLFADREIDQCPLVKELPDGSFFNSLILKYSHLTCAVHEGAYDGFTERPCFQNGNGSVENLVEQAIPL